MNEAQIALSYPPLTGEWKVVYAHRFLLMDSFIWTACQDKLSEFVVKNTDAGVLEAIKATEPHLVILQPLVHGELNGYELFEEIRRRWPHIKVIFMTPNVTPHIDSFGSVPNEFTYDEGFGPIEPAWDLLSRPDRVEGIIDYHAGAAEFRNALIAILEHGEYVTTPHFLGERPARYIEEWGDLERARNKKAMARVYRIKRRANT